jgi:zinc D-Ala-D-Ala carboxypeptidase
MKYFTRNELKCKCGCDQLVIDFNFISIIEQLREFIDYPFIVNSFYRCEEHNKKIGGSRNSFHLKGQAIDLKINGENALRLIEVARCFGITGVGVYKTFVHLDNGSTEDKKIKRPHFWVG